MGAYADLIKKLAEERSALAATLAELPVKLQAEKRKATAEELAAFDAAEAEARDLGRQIERWTEQEKREELAAGICRETGNTGADPGRASGVQVSSEPQVYGRGSPHSYFLDQARAQLGRGDADGGVTGARDRQARHEAELRTEMPARIERRRREADQAMERALSGAGRAESGSRHERRMSRRESRVYERFLADGMQVFGRETRAIGTVDGSGGYFVPPLWLVDDYIEYLRAGRELVNLWRNFPLPSGTNSVNIPRIVLGSATGAQVAEGAPLASRDMQDSFVTALIKTVAGQEDVAIQLLDQSPVSFDEIIFADLAADYNMQVDGLAQLGSGTNNQPGGVFPTGVLGTSSGASPYGFIVNDAGTGGWTTNSSGDPGFYTGVSKLLSLISRNRFMSPTALSSNPAAWYGLAGSFDGSLRPLVVPSQNGTAFNAVAEGDGSPLAEGTVGHMLGVPWTLDANWPLTFGGTTAPSIGTTSNGHTAPIPGSGGDNVFTPLFAGVMDDLFIWEGDMRSRTLSEVLSGTLQVRFQLYAYVATMVDRYQDASGNALSYGNYNNTGQTDTTAVLSTACPNGLEGF